MQNLFGIVQGGLDKSLRDRCLEGLKQRNLPGYAIGGLSGGESKVRTHRCFFPSSRMRAHPSTGEVLACREPMCRWIT